MSIDTGASALRVLVLAAALLVMLAGLARAGISGGTHRACKGFLLTPKITINGDRDPKSERYLKPYGEDLILYCSYEDTAHLEIKQNGVPQEIGYINKTTVKLHVEKPNLGNYKYSCLEPETHCEDVALVSVKPAMCVQSPMVIRKLDEQYGLMMYFVPLKANYEVFCTGNNVTNLQLLLNNRYVLPIERLGSTVKYTKKADEEVDKSYTCRSKVTEGEEVQEMVAVTAGYLPFAHRFKCFIYATGILECAWRYISNGNSFKLFYTDSLQEDAIFLCSEQLGRIKSSCKVSEWYTEGRLFLKYHNVSFILKTCSDFMCHNQTFTMNTETITQPQPVMFKIEDKSPHGAVLTWPNNCENCLYKVKFRRVHSGHQLQDTDTFARCGDKCEFYLILPYPDTSYEVWVKAGNKKAKNDILWSPPSFMYVSTKPRTKCVCNVTHRTPSDGTAAENIKCEVCSLIEDTIIENQVLYDKIAKLRENLNMIKELSNLISNSKEINNRFKKFGRVTRPKQVTIVHQHISQSKT